MHHVYVVYVSDRKQTLTKQQPSFSAELRNIYVSKFTENSFGLTG